MRTPITWLRYEVRPKSTAGRLFAKRYVGHGRETAAALESGGIPLGRAEHPLALSDDALAYLTKTKTNALLVVRGGLLETEWYGRGWRPERQHSSWSVAKSLVSLAAGNLIERGVFSEHTRLVEVLPEFATGDAYDRVTIGELLDMRSGIKLDERYGPWFRYVGVQGMYMSTNIPRFLLARRRTFAEPGGRAVYRSVDAQLLGLAIARAVGRPLADIVRNEFWQALGAQDAAWWSLDHAGGVEKAFGSFNATARDFARVGAMMAAGGRIGGRQVVSEAWMRRVRTPIGQFPLEPGWDYSAFWWHGPGWADHGDYMARGYYGQYVYVHPRAGVAIVRLADNPHEDPAATLVLLRKLAETAGE